VATGTSTRNELTPTVSVLATWEKAQARPGQLLSQHMNEVSSGAAQFGKKCGIGEMSRIAGFLHDLGKIQVSFQRKLDDINHDARVQHSIYGAKRVFADTACILPIDEILANIIASHHGSLHDNLAPDGDTPLLNRLMAVTELFPPPLSSPIINTDTLHNEFMTACEKMHSEDKAFSMSMLTKLVYSCLVDADRLNAYHHDNNLSSSYNYQPPDWGSLLAHLVGYLADKNAKHSTPVKPPEHLPICDAPDMKKEMVSLRQGVSEDCENAGQREQGIYRLEVPTGGGKTLASLRFALAHAKKYSLDRIVFVIPYLSILSQTAAEIRDALGADEATVLEHHSGFLPGELREKREYYKLQTDRWDAPIILTTQVQFLESVFSAKGSDLRKLHNMANSVMIFDEAQSLPIKCIHLFNGVINFLNQNCGTTVLLCTATQPQFDKVKRKLRFSHNPSIVECGAFTKRTKIVNAIKMEGYTPQSLAAFVLEKHHTSTLVIMNTKAAAKSLYDELNESETDITITDTSGSTQSLPIGMTAAGVPLLHLSTNMCAAHRDDVIAELRRKLGASEPVICISTQLIEAGVDISFECVIRNVAGLDSILQAAGRCNRHGEFGQVKDVYVVNIAGENLSRLPDIKEGAEITQRLFHEGRENDINAYYQYYFSTRRNRRDMDFPVSDDGSIYDLLSINKQGQYAYINRGCKHKVPDLLSAIRSAADAFFVIDRGRKDIVVPYGEAMTLISQYENAYTGGEKNDILRRLGKYSVSLYSYQERILSKSHALIPRGRGEITTLTLGFYNPVRGLDMDGQHELLYL